jgi:hypothetical protein
VAAFVAAQRAEHNVPVAVACGALGVSPAWFYKWRDGDVSLRRARRRALADLVATLFARHRGRYGSPRIAAELRELGWRVSDNTVAALMAEQHLVARPKRRRKTTTRPGKGRWREGIHGRQQRPESLRVVREVPRRGHPPAAPNRPRGSPLEAEATPYLRVRNSPGATRGLPKASLGDRESVLEVLELVGGHDDGSRLVLVADHDPFPVPCRVSHEGLQGWNDRG